LKAISNTKSRILETARLLFNSSGYVNVTMREISSQVGISPGNLAYHYKNKALILEGVYKQMTREVSDLLAAAGSIPSFINISNQIEPYLLSQTKFRFFYQDTLEICRAHPEIAELHRTNTEEHINSIRAFIDYSVGSGSLITESDKGIYDRLALTTWMTLSFWSSQSEIRNKHTNLAEASKIFWSQLLPYLTKEGESKFQSIQNLNSTNSQLNLDKNQTSNLANK
jgi:AcrR family transcriptional regulator